MRRGDLFVLALCSPVLSVLLHEVQQTCGVFFPWSRLMVAGICVFSYSLSIMCSLS